MPTRGQLQNPRLLYRGFLYVLAADNSPVAWAVPAQNPPRLEVYVPKRFNRFINAGKPNTGVAGLEIPLLDLNRDLKKAKEAYEARAEGAYDFTKNPKDWVALQVLIQQTEKWKDKIEYGVVIYTSKSGNHSPGDEFVKAHEIGHVRWDTYREKFSLKMRPGVSDKAKARSKGVAVTMSGPKVVSPYISHLYTAIRHNVKALSQWDDLGMTMLFQNAIHKAFHKKNNVSILDVPVAGGEPLLVHMFKLLFTEKVWNQFVEAVMGLRPEGKLSPLATNDIVPSEIFADLSGYEHLMMKFNSRSSEALYYSYSPKALGAMIRKGATTKRLIATLEDPKAITQLLSAALEKQSPLIDVMNEQGKTKAASIR